MVVDNPAEGSHPAIFWRSLLYFNLYRLTLAGIFVFLSIVFSSSLAFGASHILLFFKTSVVYLGLAIGSIVLLHFRWPRFNLQLAGQMAVDIAVLTVLSYASGGIQSNVGLLLLVSLASAGMISRGRITLFFAALASIAALLGHAYAVLYVDADPAKYIQVGLLCIAYFAVAWLAHTLAKYAVDSQKLAQRRGRDLVSLSEANRLVMRDMEGGVVVVDGQGMIMQMNQSAERLLRKSIGQENLLSETFPLLYEEYMVWQQTGKSNQDILLLDEGLQARLRFLPIEKDAIKGVVIFLEDMRRVQAEAQQIKLVALGRLTANIAHEVRNPLSAISYATELLQEEQIDTNQRRLLKIVLDNTQRINQIVQDVMQLNRRDRAQPEALDLGVMLRVFIEEFCMAERVKPDVIVLKSLPGIGITFDRGHLRQILWNLCHNALRYCSRLPGSLKLTVLEVNRRLVLDLQDDGSGIPVNERGKLFEPFFTTVKEGTGLGLYIAKELCEANSSLLEYRELEKQGACFRITFGEVNRDKAGAEYDG